MNPNYLVKTVFALTLTAIFMAPTWACRFNVRDVGFVDFGQTPYQLFVAFDQSTTKEQRDALEQIGFAALLESNVQIEMVDLDQSTDHDVIQHLIELDIETRPAVILVSPKGEALHLPVPTGQTSFRDAVWQLMESIITNETRESILDDSIDHYGIVLVIEGEDGTLNQTAITAAQEAVEEVASRMDSLPKEIKQPPVVKRLTYQEAKSESVFLWALGINQDDLAQPHAAILYGRGRCIGEVLKGQSISKSTVGEILSVIGLSCECGLDREWMMGRQFPLRWDAERQEQVVKSLGFDAESPLVKTEISQIMAIGQQNAVGSGSSRNVSLNPIMGYSEMIVEAAPVEPPDAPRVVEDEPQVIASNDVKSTKPEPQLSTAIQVDAASEAAAQPRMSLGLMLLIVAATLSLVTGVAIIIWARSKNV